MRRALLGLIISAFVLTGASAGLGPASSKSGLASIRSRPDLNRSGPVKGDGTISLENLHTREALLITYRRPDGSYNKPAFARINRLLRCHYNHKSIKINRDLIELVDAIQDHFDPRARIEVISGYRSPEYNSLLRSRGRRVAKRSLHMSGWAMDIRIPGVTTKSLYTYARSLTRGGVGFYPEPSFVHVDVGRVRFW